MSLNGCLLGIENELDDGVGQTRVVGGNKADDSMLFNLQWIFTLKYVKI